MVRGAEPVPAARRPDPQPGQHREGVRRPGAAGADRRHRGPRKGHLHQCHARARERPGRVPAIRAGAARGDRRAVAPAGGGGELPAAQVRPELPRAAGTARGHREPYRGGAPALHQSGSGIQHQRAPVPGQPDRDGVRLQAESAVQRRGRKGDRQTAHRRLRHAGQKVICFYAPLIRGEAGGFGERGGLILRKAKTPRSPSARDPLVRGSAAAALLLTLLASFFAWAIEVPPLKARVTDMTGTLNGQQRGSLEQTLAEFEARKGAQLAVLIVPTTQPETVEQYAVRVEEAWKLGRKGVDDSVLLVVAKNDRRLHFEVGYGLEGVLPDAIAKRIIDNDIVPRFRENDFYGGIRAGMDRVMRVVEGEK